MTAPRPRRVTTAWTEAHSTVVAALATAGLAGFATVYQPAAMQLPVVGVLLACVVVSLSTNGFVGLSVGLVGAAAVVALHRWLSTWDSLDFGPTLVVAVLVVGAGWTAGACGAQLRELWQDVAGPTDGASGSLGLFTREAAEFRLGEEVGRAWEFGRPLSVAMISLQFHEGVRSADRRAARRAVGRLVESGLSAVDTPFDNLAGRPSSTGPGDPGERGRTGAHGEHGERGDHGDHGGAEFGAVLPERSSADAWRAIGPIMTSARTATYVVRDPATDEADWRNLLDVADISVGIVALTRSSTPASLIESARGAALRPAEPQDLREHH